MGALVLAGMAVAAAGLLWWEFRKTRSDVGLGWAARYTPDRVEDHALRYNPTWQAERRKVREAARTKTVQRVNQPGRYEDRTGSANANVSDSSKAA